MKLVIGRVDAEAAGQDLILADGAKRLPALVRSRRTDERDRQTASDRRHDEIGILALRQRIAADP